jgi:hypothetical protein
MVEAPSSIHRTEVAGNLTKSEVSKWQHTQVTAGKNCKIASEQASKSKTIKGSKLTKTSFEQLQLP